MLICKKHHHSSKESAAKCHRKTKLQQFNRLIRIYGVDEYITMTRSLKRYSPPRPVTFTTGLVVFVFSEDPKNTPYADYGDRKC
jgi:hypothetical protein